MPIHPREIDVQIRGFFIFPSTAEQARICIDETIRKENPNMNNLF